MFPELDATFPDSLNVRFPAELGFSQYHYLTENHVGVINSGCYQPDRKVTRSVHDIDSRGRFLLVDKRFVELNANCTRGDISTTMTTRERHFTSSAVVIA